MDHTLQITDPVTEQIYELILSKEDFEKAHSDENFANSLLFHARVTSAGTQVNAATTSTSNMIDHVNISKSCSNIVENENTKTVAIWGYNQTLSLINSMATHYNDLNDVKKRKYVFDNVSNDLVSNGFEVSAIMIQNKWKSLVRSYKKAKDNKNRTGQGPTRFLFFELMDDLLGQAPSNKCDHSINTMANIDIENVQSDASNENNTDEVTNETEEDTVEDTCKENRNKNEKRKRLSEKKIRAQYIDLKLNEYERRKRRHDEKMDLEKQKLDLEKRKLTVLEEYLNYRKN